ncbi:MAG: type II secretion system F family protein [Candidatus Bathyarchaeota archaeon]|nr:type II secretion system F family protein [Candidatus Bathyarchaeota archaeon]MDW8039843.1 type II secretion system F family protein [Nitrososphaerota archaeon]
MKKAKVSETFKKLYASLLSLLKGFNPKNDAEKTSGGSGGHVKLKAESLSSFAYRLVGGKISPLLPLFQDLSNYLQRAGIKTNFRAYISLAVFSTTLIALATFTFIPFVLFSVFKIPAFPAVMFGLGGSLFAVAFSVAGFYIYPVYRADKTKRDLEDELAFATGYMAILASAGVSPEKIFHSLSKLPIPLAVSAEAKNIIRDVNLFGLDIISALENASKRSPSVLFREMLEGFISTIHSGSSLAVYLREKSKQHMKLKRISLRKFSDTLSILSEFYVALLVTGPLLFIIMLAVMSMMGGGSIGFLGPDLLLNILTYIGIPVGSIMFLIILDSVSPKW